MVQRWCRGAHMVAAQVSPNDQTTLGAALVQGRVHGCSAESPNDFQGASQVAKAVQNACQKRGRGRPRRPKSQPEIDLGGFGPPRVVLGTLRGTFGTPPRAPRAPSWAPSWAASWASWEPRCRFSGPSWTSWACVGMQARIATIFGRCRCVAHKLRSAKIVAPANVS